MITTLEHGVTIPSDAVASIIQKCEVEEKQSESNLLGMVSGLTQVVKTWLHTKILSFSVTGSGSLTLATGTGATSTLSLISGGITNILTFKYMQELGKPSEWTYTGNNFPSAS